MPSADPSTSNGHSAEISESPTLTNQSSSPSDNNFPGSYPPIIPPSHPARTLVLCFDGTGDQFDADNSNVVQFFSMLKKDDRNEQMVYYQAGIGTYTTPQVATPFMAKLSRTLDAMIAWNLNAHVMGGYEFLMQNYNSGDKICIFGFSRGAYTARALAGMVHKVGLLPACNHQQVPFAYKMFTRTDELGWAQSTAFKKAFSMDVDIEFVGVWDTVCSVGLIPQTLPFTTSNTSIRTFRHAVSLDEHRAKFKANLFNRPTKAEAKLGTQPGEMPKAGALPSDTVIALDNEESCDGSEDEGEGPAEPEPKPEPKPKATEEGGWAAWDSTLIQPDEHLSKSQSQEHLIAKQTSAKGGKKPEKAKKAKKKDVQKELERKYSQQNTSTSTSTSTILETDVLEVWFAGCHCDVGGGSVPNDTRHNLARIPLRWMIRQCFLSNTGIRFHADLLPAAGLNPSTLYPVVLPRPPPIASSPYVPLPLTSANPVPQTLINYADVAPSALTEEEEDLADALCPIYDQLVLAPFWWILEVLPMKHRVQQEDDSWTSDLFFNMGRGRKIHKQKKQGFNVHRTVKLRMEREGLPGGKYVPHAHFRAEPTWVD